jgi:hypothetical protein
MLCLQRSTFADLPPPYHVILDLFEVSIKVRTKLGPQCSAFGAFSRSVNSQPPFFNASLDLFEVSVDVLNEVHTGQGQVMLWLLRNLSLAPKFEELQINLQIAF